MAEKLLGINPGVGDLKGHSVKTGQVEGATPTVPGTLNLGGGNSNIFWNFHPENWGRWTHFDSYFSNGLVQPPTRCVSFKFGRHF